MKPEHYKGRIDPIMLMEAQLTTEQLYGFFVGNVIKYAARAHKKNGREDLRKAQDYLNRALALGDTQRIARYSAAATDEEKRAILRGCEAAE